MFQEFSEAGTAGLKANQSAPPLPYLISCLELISLATMGQEFQILRCFQCKTFQVQIVKKNNSKFECKMCQLKQSTKQIFFTSASAQECRDRVKELNASRGELENRKSEQLLESQVRLLVLHTYFCLYSTHVRTCSERFDHYVFV